ncbi:hypothetical protein [Belnapia rosea]|uniref:Uncharacterized protein n=1 Tax=Belnapia rosea TaxID=938405 RepID=A0A1G7DFN4_9PROT|nr:hypothetical protein [Belnapia rosea]SDE50342.1 hypothetical protein SAMN04487779_10452 [Belnapia rosea]
MNATDPVALLAAALAGLDPEAQADVLEDMLQAHIQACHRTAPDMPSEEIHRLFSLLARAALALLDETREARQRQ